MKDKVVVITGAGSGIGRHCARNLAQQGATLVLHARSIERVQPVVDEIKQLGGKAEAVCFDLASKAAVLKGAGEIAARFPAIHALINNAGLWLGKARRTTPDGLEETWAVNTLAPHLMTRTLLPNLKAAGEARVVNVASNEHRFGNMNWDDTQFEKGWAARHTYRQSKLALVMLTNELARREPGIRANSLHPGIGGTPLFRNYPRFIQFWINLLMRTPEACAQPVAKLAEATETGKFFDRFKAKPPHKTAQDAEACKRVWDIVEKQAG